jgi:hypothetical protein
LCTQSTALCVRAEAIQLVENLRSTEQQRAGATTAPSAALLLPPPDDQKAEAEKQLEADDQKAEAEKLQVAEETRKRVRRDRQRANNKVVLDVQNGIDALVKALANTSSVDRHIQARLQQEEAEKLRATTQKQLEADDQKAEAEKLEVAEKLEAAKAPHTHGTHITYVRIKCSTLTEAAGGRRGRARRRGQGRGGQTR